MIDDNAPTYFLVTGRILGDDEDTPRIYELPSPSDVNDAYRIYAAEMRDEYIEAMIESGEKIDRDIEVFVNSIFISAAPIEEVWNYAVGSGKRWTDD